jgi:single-strand DNA-binding protein
MRDVATAQLSGNLTRDVDLRSLPSGADVAKLRVASTTRRRAGEEWVDKTNYFTVEVFGAQARSCAEYLRKGSRVIVDAELDWHEWTDQQESKREAVTLKARKVLFEDRRQQPDSANGHADDRTPSPAPAPQPAAAPVPVAASAPANDAGSARADELPY